MLQVANWGCGSESVLDAASLAEQYARTKDRDDPDVWGFYLRKDLFEPVINPNNDKVDTNLINHQIIGGILTGEYVCSQVNWIRQTKINSLNIIIVVVIIIIIMKITCWVGHYLFKPHFSLFFFFSFFFGRKKICLT